MRSPNDLDHQPFQYDELRSGGASKNSHVREYDQSRDPKKNIRRPLATLKKPIKPFRTNMGSVPEREIVIHHTKVA